jgi:glutaredoxin-dependent peroxiredoxin
VPLLSDWNGDAVHAFGIATELNGLRDVAERTAFLADVDGVVRGAWRYEAGEVPDVDDFVRAAQSI